MSPALPVARLVVYAAGMTCAALSIPLAWASVPAPQLPEKAPGMIRSLEQVASLPRGTEFDVIGAAYHAFGLPGWSVCVLVVGAIAMLTLNVIGVCRISRWLPFVFCCAGVVLAGYVLAANPRPLPGILLLLAGSAIGGAGAILSGKESAASAHGT